MNRERELLKQVVENFAYVQDMHLIVAIQKLLNQPEQEPVAWMYDLDMMIHPISNTRSQRFGELTSIDPTDRQQDAVNIRPLYTAPPKREPLSESKIAAIWDDSDKTDVAITRAIEKAHGITGGGE
jgi:hypothetical protein